MKLDYFSIANPQKPPLEGLILFGGGLFSVVASVLTSKVCLPHVSRSGHLSSAHHHLEEM